MQLPVSWRLLRTPPADGAWNMACDLALMTAARADGVGILRVYEWSAATVSFGRHERTSGIYTLGSLDECGLVAVRRPTGGRALLHSREVTYSVAMPIDDRWRWNVAYDRVNERLLSAMLALNIPAHIVADARDPVFADTRFPALGRPASRMTELKPVPTPHDEPHVCFSGVASGEIAVGGRKLIASSVWRERGAYLQHGSVLIHDDQSRLIPLLGPGARKPQPAAVLSEWLTTLPSDRDTVDLVESALHMAFRDCGNVVPWSIPTEVLDDVEKVRAALAESSWLWRR